MKPVALTAISEATGGRLVGRRNGAATGVSTDTRDLTPGDAFFALVAKRDGHEFVQSAFAAGALVAVVSKPVHVPPGRAAVIVDDTLEALGKFAAYYRRQMQASVVGITGSNGKTTTKEMLACILSATAPTIKSPESFNNAIGVPRTLFRIEKEDKFAVVEIGTSSPGEISYLSQIARPQLGIITTIASSHLAGLGSVKGVAAEKAALIQALPATGTAILNADNYWCRQIAQQTQARVVTFGIEEEADLQPTDIHCSGVSVRFSLMGETLMMPVTGRHNIYNALAAIAAALELGVELADIRDRLASFRLPPMRMQRIDIGGVTIYNDAYNANLDSMRAALKEYARMPVPGRRVVVCGDMLELGESSQKSHSEIGRQVATGGFDLLIAIGKEAGYIVKGAAAHGMSIDRIVHYSETDIARQELLKRLELRDTLLLKASRGMKLEGLVDAVATWDPAGAPIKTDVGEEAYHAYRPALRERVGM